MVTGAVPVRTGFQRRDDIEISTPVPDKGHRVGNLSAYVVPGEHGGPSPDGVHVLNRSNRRWSVPTEYQSSGRFDSTTCQCPPGRRSP